MRSSDWSSDVCSSDLLRRRRIVDELIEIGLVDDLARRRRDIHADLERVGIDVGKLPARQVAQHMFQTLEQAFAARFRSEEHTSELQSLMRISYAVFCLKKKKITTYRVVSAT